MLPDLIERTCFRERSIAAGGAANQQSGRKQNVVRLTNYTL